MSPLLMARFGLHALRSVKGLAARFREPPARALLAGCAGHAILPLDNVLLAQQSALEPSRAPAGKHTGWAYRHVPPGSTLDQTEAIERQVERFAPGFRALILARHKTAPAAWELSCPGHCRAPHFTGPRVNRGALLSTPPSGRRCAWRRTTRRSMRCGRAAAASTRR